jgi:hypothetical protein
VIVMGDEGLGIGDWRLGPVSFPISYFQSPVSYLLLTPLRSRQIVEDLLDVLVLLQPVDELQDLFGLVIG